MDLVREPVFNYVIQQKYPHLRLEYLYLWQLPEQSIIIVEL
jgi:hypothetical protein